MNVVHFKFLLFLILSSCVTFTPVRYYNASDYETYLQTFCEYSHSEPNQLNYLTKGHYEKEKLDCYICKEIKKVYHEEIVKCIK